jgi:hypothetical protein
VGKVAFWSQPLKHTMLNGCNWPLAKSIIKRADSFKPSRRGYNTQPGVDLLRDFVDSTLQAQPIAMDVNGIEHLVLEVAIGGERSEFKPHTHSLFVHDLGGVVKVDELIRSIRGSADRIKIPTACCASISQKEWIYRMSIRTDLMP